MNLEEVKEHFKNAKVVKDLCSVYNLGEVELKQPLETIGSAFDDIWFASIIGDAVKVYTTDYNGEDVISDIVEYKDVSTLTPI